MGLATAQPAVQSDTVARAWAALAPLTDPEIPVVTLRELGILRDVRQGAVDRDGVEALSDHAVVVLLMLRVELLLGSEHVGAVRGHDVGHPVNSPGPE